MEIFCNVINVFTVAFDEFNVSLLNKTINFLKKMTSNFWTVVYVLFGRVF